MLAPTNIPCRNFELKSVVLWQKLISLNLKFDRKDGKSRISRWMPHKTPNPNRSLRRNRNRSRHSKPTKTKSRFLQKNRFLSCDRKNTSAKNKISQMINILMRRKKYCFDWKPKKLNFSHNRWFFYNCKWKRLISKLILTIKK